MSECRAIGLIRDPQNKYNFGQMLKSQRNYMEMTQREVIRKARMNSSYPCYELGSAAPTSAVSLISLINVLEFSDNDIWKLYCMKDEPALREALMTDERISKIINRRKHDPSFGAAQTEKRSDLNMIYALATNTYIPHASSPTSPLSVRKETRVLDIAGGICNYHVNSGTGEIELVNFDDKTSLVTGVLDKESLGAFISELKELAKFLD